MLAGFFSFKSGSDNSLLYDTLQALGRESEYASREANATRVSMLALALSAFIGGVSGFQPGMALCVIAGRCCGNAGILLAI